MTSSERETRRRGEGYEAEREIKSEGGNIAISTIFRVRVSFETRNPPRVSGDMRYDITQYGVRALSHVPERLSQSSDFRLKLHALNTDCLASLSSIPIHYSCAG